MWRRALIRDQLNAGFSKVCEIFKVRCIESLKYFREFHTPVCYCGDISTHRNVTLNEANCDWLFDMSVKRPHGRALANKCCHLFQTFSRQSEGLATRDYSNTKHQVTLWELSGLRHLWYYTTVHTHEQTCWNDSSCQWGVEHKNKKKKTSHSIQTDQTVSPFSFLIRVGDPGFCLLLSLLRGVEHFLISLPFASAEKKEWI